MSNFLSNELFHTFINDTGNFCEVNTTIEELFKTDLSSSADSASADFESLFSFSKLEDFIYTSKTNGRVQDKIFLPVCEKGVSLPSEHNP